MITSSLTTVVDQIHKEYELALHLFMQGINTGTIIDISFYRFTEISGFYSIKLSLLGLGNIQYIVNIVKLGYAIMDIADIFTSQ